MWSHHPAAYTPVSPKRQRLSTSSATSPTRSPSLHGSLPPSSPSHQPLSPSPSPEASIEDLCRQRTASTKNQYPVNLTKIITGDRDRDAVFIKFAATWYDSRELAIQQFEQGLPRGARGSAWQLVSRSCELLEKNTKAYKQLLLKTSHHMNNIQMDTERTLPCLENFDMRQRIEAINVLKAYSVVDPLLGYSQGMNYIVAMVVSVMPEENAFWFLVRMMKAYSLERLYPNSTCALQECFTQFETLAEAHLPDLSAHLNVSTMTSSSLYLPQWFQTVFLYSSRMDLSIRVMDLIVIRGIEALFRVGLAILTIAEDFLIMKCKTGNALEAVNFLKRLDAEELPTQQVLDVALALPNELLSQAPAEPTASPPSEGCIIS